MKEIKFRAWDNVENKMIYIGEDRDYSFEVTSTGIVCTKLGDNPFDWETLSHLAYQQYTGLKDRNGKGIYEGDIIRLYNEEYYKEVLWTGQGFGYRVIKNKTNRGFIEGHLSKSGLNFYSDISEVVSNIYENPELLTLD